MNEDSPNQTRDVSLPAEKRQGCVTGSNVVQPPWELRQELPAPQDGHLGPRTFTPGHRAHRKEDACPPEDQGERVQSSSAGRSRPSATGEQADVAWCTAIKPRLVPTPTGGASPAPLFSVILMLGALLTPKRRPLPGPASSAGSPSTASLGGRLSRTH